MLQKLKNKPGEIKNLWCHLAVQGCLKTRLSRES